MSNLDPVKAKVADNANTVEGLSLKNTMLINNFGINKKCTDVLDLSQCDGQWYGCIGGYTNNMPRGAGIGVKKSMAYDSNWVIVFFLDVESNQIFTNAWSRDGGWKGWHDYHNAGYAVRAGAADTLTGYSIIKPAYISGQARSINNEKSYAWLNIPVGVQFAGCSAIISVYMGHGTPYTQIYNACAASVGSDGGLNVEVCGFGFIPAHTFAFQVILYR